MKTKIKAPSNLYNVAPGVWGRKDVFVNFYIVQDLINDQWVLVDTGLKWSAHKIREMARYLFGPDSLPIAIVLTHGHFDHVGSVVKLAEGWNIPVYAHHLEIPYLTGQSNYPPADPTTGGGLMASLAFLYPASPVNIWKHIKVLPAGGKIPVLPEWKYIHTPGHTPGHISLYRESDSVLIAGDAFVTTKAESALATITQKKKVSGPPKYFTCDWEAAKLSVEILADLHPNVAATGHGKPMAGEELQQALDKLAKNFDKKAVPAQGRYIPNPAITNANGVVYLPPKKMHKSYPALKAFVISAVVTLAIVWSTYKKRRKITNENLIDVEYNY